jgi:hypothetical protein
MHAQSPSSSCGPCCRLFGSLVSSQQNHLSASEYGLWNLLALSDDLCRDFFDAPLDLWIVDGFSTDLFEKMYISHRRAYRRIFDLSSAPVFDNRLDLGLGGAAVKWKNTSQHPFLRFFADLEHLHQDFLTMSASGGFCYHLAGSSRVEDLHPFGFAWRMSMSYLQVMVSEHPRGEPFDLAAGE